MIVASNFNTSILTTISEQKIDIIGKNVKHKGRAVHIML